jgi:hypothetical protein
MNTNRGQLALIGLSTVAGTIISLINILCYLQGTPYDQDFGFGAIGILLILPSVATLGLLNTPVMLGTIFIWQVIFKKALSRSTVIKLYIGLLPFYLIGNWFILEPFRFGSFATAGVVPVSITAYTILVYVACLILRRYKTR